MDTKLPSINISIAPGISKSESPNYKCLCHSSTQLGNYSLGIDIVILLRIVTLVATKIGSSVVKEIKSHEVEHLINLTRCRETQTNSVQVLKCCKNSFFALYLVIDEICEPLPNKTLIDTYDLELSFTRTNAVAKTTLISTCDVPEKLGDNESTSFLSTTAPDFSSNFADSLLFVVVTCLILIYNNM